MILGVYTTYLSAVSIVNMSVILPMAIGVVIGSLLFMKLIHFLLNKFHSTTIFGIIGFSLGSIFILYPIYHFDSISLISIFLLIISFLLGKHIKKEKED